MTHGADQDQPPRGAAPARGRTAAAWWCAAAAGAEPLVAAVTVIGVLLLGRWAARAGGRAERLGAALAAAGAAGNLADRLARAPRVLHGGSGEGGTAGR